MFRRRGKESSLPRTSLTSLENNSGIFPSALSPLGSSRRRSSDGSAASIRVPVPAVQAIKKAPFSTKLTCSLIIFFLFLAYYGYRHLRWSGALVLLDCGADACQLQLHEPSSWRKKLTFDFHRSQLENVYPVKCTKEGDFVLANPDLAEPSINYANPRKGQAKKKYSQNYKGPDSSGHYFSYAFVFRERRNVDEGELKGLDVLTDRIETADPNNYRLIIRRFRIAQTKRRVRMMVQKVESYIRRRRHQLYVKETAPPSWQGLLCLVFGIIGLLLTILIGALVHEGYEYNQNTRRRQSSLSVRRPQPPRKLDRSVYSKVQTPSRFEVSTKPAIARTTNKSRKSATGATGVRRRN